MNIVDSGILSVMSNGNDVAVDNIVSGLQDAKIKRGDVVLVHAAMRTFGNVQGGGKTVVEAFLKVLGPEGTLIMPTFTFAHEAEKDPVIDPRTDKSEMGAISEALRLHPDALRSTAFRHSFAAVGRRAEVVAKVDPELSPFDLRSSFGVMLALDTKVLLMGLTYSSCTSHHFAEWVCDVPYRHTVPLNVKVRGSDGSIAAQQMTDYQPKPGKDGSYYGSRHTDFNFLGKMLEDRNLVNISFIGNAVIRSFAMRDLICLAEAEAKKDYNVFRAKEGSKSGYFTHLDTGRIVISGDMKDGAGRLAHYQWCVCDETKLMANK